MPNEWLEERRFSGLDEVFRRTEPYIIAEIGSNWVNDSGSENHYENCLGSIEIAKACGAHAVKFQMFNHMEMYGRSGDDKYALPVEYLSRLAQHCSRLGIDFLCSGFSVDGLKTIEPHVKMHKIASSKVGDKNVIEYIKNSDKKFIVSDGMFDVPELDNVIPMICAANYPAQLSDYNLFKLSKYAHVSLGFGFSDHTLTYSLAQIMRAHGCTYFEKHVNFLRNSKSPDSCVSVGAEQFATYIRIIKSTEVGRPRVTKATARRLWGDKYDEKLKRYVRPKK
jgi:sialic acid synthase SpsE